MKNNNPFTIAILLIILIGVLTILTSCGEHSFDGRDSFTDGKDSYDDPPSSSSSSEDSDDDDKIYIGEDGEDEEIIEDEEIEEEEDIYEEE